MDVVYNVFAEEHYMEDLYPHDVFVATFGDELAAHKYVAEMNNLVSLNSYGLKHYRVEKTTVTESLLVPHYYEVHFEVARRENDYVALAPYVTDVKTIPNDCIFGHAIRTYDWSRHMAGSERFYVAFVVDTIGRKRIELVNEIQFTADEIVQHLLSSKECEMISIDDKSGRTAREWADKIIEDIANERI